MSLRKFLEKRTEAKTPILIKIAIIFQALILFRVFGMIPRMTHDLQVLQALLAIAVQVIALIAIWNLRRWGVLAYIIVSIIGLVTSIASPEVQMSLKVIQAIVIFRAITIIPSLIYWKRMSWP